MARQKWVPDAAERRQVQAMAAYGIPQDDIARVLGVAPKTLRSACRDELDTGTTVATAKVAEGLYQEATAGKDPRARVTAQIFWLKTRAGWKETTLNEHTGKDGRPIVIRISPEDADL
ncbi:MAG TPA: hypothetical protein VFA12_20335 [Stellaceae bacterium]|nr:hypothetical protein [Stellaceae bacterium]